MRPALLTTYGILAIITGWVSFSTRRLPMEEAIRLQRDIWQNLVQPGLVDVHASLLQYHAARVLFPTLMQVPLELGLPAERVFPLLRLATIVATYILFHLFLREWFSESLAFCGTLFLAATIPLTFNNWLEFPTDFVEILVFILGLWFAYKERYVAFCITVFIGAFNRESTAVLPFLLFFVLFDRRRFGWIVPVGVATALAVIPVLVLRWWTGTFAPHGFGDYAHNVQGIRALLTNPHPYNNYLFWFYLFGTFWFVPFLGWAQQPSYFKRLLIGMAASMVVYVLVGGYWDEPRELVHLYPLIVPAALFALFPQEAGESERRTQAPAEQRIHG